MTPGTPLLFERGTASWRNSAHGDGVAYVLDDKNSYKEPNRRWTEYGFVKTEGLKGHVLVVTIDMLRDQDDIPAEVHELLSALRVDDLDAKFNIPEDIDRRVTAADGVFNLNIRVIPAGQLKGEWVTEVASRRAQEAKEREARVQQDLARRNRNGRWSKIAYFLTSLNGNLYTRYEADARLSVRLEDMETIMELLKAAYPNMDIPTL